MLAPESSKKGPRWFDVDEVEAQVGRSAASICATTLLKLEEEPAALEKLPSAQDLLGLSCVQV